MKYTVIKSKAQYNEYCKMLWALLDKEGENKAIDDEIELLELLIEKYDQEHGLATTEMNPVELLTYLMAENKMKAKDLAELLGVSPGLVSDILNYRKGLSKEVIRKLSGRFKMQQEAFNRPYPLAGAAPKAKRKIRTKTSKTVKDK